MLSGGNDSEIEEGTKLFDDAIQYWSSQSNKDDLVLDFQMQKADFLLKHKRYDEVRNIFESLSSESDALKIQANLIKATCFSDLEKATQLAEQLEISDEVPDCMSLIEAGCVGGLGKRKLKLDRMIETIRAKTAKKSKTEKQIDPKAAERWKPKRRKRKKRGQGTAV